MGSKAFASVDKEQFTHFAAKALLSEKVVLDTVRETIEAFRDTWDSASDLQITPHVKEAMNRHRKSLPLWTHR